MLGAARLEQQHRHAAAAPAGLGLGDRGVFSTVGEKEIKSCRGCQLQSPPGHRELSPSSALSPSTSPAAAALWAGRCRRAQGPELTPQTWSLCHRGHTSSASLVRDELTPLPGLRDALFWGVSAGQAEHKGPFPDVPRASLSHVSPDLTQGSGPDAVGSWDFPRASTRHMHLLLQECTALGTGDLQPPGSPEGETPVEDAEPFSERPETAGHGACRLLREWRAPSAPSLLGAAGPTGQYWPEGSRPPPRRFPERQTLSSSPS